MCWFLHPKDICRNYLKDGKCSDKDCSSRHANFCRYQKKVCNREYTCAYQHSDGSTKVENQYDMSDENYLESNYHDPEDIVTYETMEADSIAGYSESNLKKYAHGQSERTKNHCYQCKCYFCGKQFKFNDESIFDFFKSNKF